MNQANPGYIEDSLNRCISSLKEAIEHEEVEGMAWTHYYSMLRKQKRLLEKTLKKLGRIQIW